MSLQMSWSLLGKLMMPLPGKVLPNSVLETQFLFPESIP